MVSAKVPEEDFRLIEAATGLIQKQVDPNLTRSDVIYTGVMRYVREVLRLPEAA